MCWACSRMPTRGASPHPGFDQVVHVVIRVQLPGNIGRGARLRSAYLRDQFLHAATAAILGERHVAHRGTRSWGVARHTLRSFPHAHVTYATHPKFHGQAVTSRLARPRRALLPYPMHDVGVTSVL